jgi:hypothetical protein
MSAITTTALADASLAGIGEAVTELRELTGRTHRRAAARAQRL